MRWHAGHAVPVGAVRGSCIGFTGTVGRAERGRRIARPGRLVGSPGGGAFDPEALGLSLEPVVDRLVSPLAVTHAGDGSGRIFVLEQRGQIRIVRDGQLLGDPFLNIGDRLTAGGEHGLLGLAFHPDFPDDPRFFVNYTDLEGDTVVSSFTAEAGADRADGDSEVVLLRIDQPYPNHNGGALAFGPDGYLYISTGDGGAGGDPHDNGQRMDTLLGKILRIDVDGGSGDARYAVPPDNPFVDQSDALPEIWHLGLRNPWRMSFDRETGDLWIGDVGQGSWEEVDVARAGTGGLNFGWNQVEGFECFEGDYLRRPGVHAAGDRLQPRLRLLGDRRRRLPGDGPTAARRADTSTRTSAAATCGCSTRRTTGRWTAGWSRRRGATSARSARTRRARHTRPT